MSVDTYNAAGTFTWTCPAGVTSVQVECWGGGANGGRDNSQTGGGGGGAYAKKNSVSVTPGTGYTVVVGLGGVHSGTDTAGGDSYFVSTGTVLAKGGNANSSSTGGTGGQSASCVGDSKFTGGNGGNSAAFAGGGGGSSAGTAAGGNNGSNGSGATAGNGGTAPTGGAAGGKGSTTSVAGVNGSASGGGGGGSCSGSGVGGSGADGKVVLTYTAATQDTPELYGHGQAVMQQLLAQ